MVSPEFIFTRTPRNVVSKAKGVSLAKIVLGHPNLWCSSKNVSSGPKILTWAKTVGAWKIEMSLEDLI